jgi:hypothetical protein
MKIFKTARVVAATTLATLILATPALAATTSSTPSHAAKTAHVLKTRKIAFKASYSGTLTFLLTGSSSSSSASVTSVTGHGPATLLGTSTLSGTGNVPATASSSGFHFTGTGKIVGHGGSLSLRIVSSSGNAPEDTAGVVTLSGSVKIISGTGSFKRATGTLKFSGDFAIANDGTTGTQSPAFSSKISGTITVPAK